MKAGSVRTSDFTRKFGVAPHVQFAGALDILDQRGLLEVRQDSIALTRPGLLQVDRLLFEFFRPEHQTGRFA